jgi:hypothetical protein
VLERQGQFSLLQHAAAHVLLLLRNPLVHSRSVFCDEEFGSGKSRGIFFCAAISPNFDLEQPLVFEFCL